MISIYKIKNVITGNFYIGVTKSYEQRIMSHFSNLRSKATYTQKGYSPIMISDFKLHGEKSFVFGVIREVDLTFSQALALEKYLIEQLKPIYNNKKLRSRDDFGFAPKPIPIYVKANLIKYDLEHLKK